MDRKQISNRPSADVSEQQFWLARAMDAREADRDESRTHPTLRQSLRRPLELHALINHGLTYSVPWHVRDLNLAGAFVELDAAHLPEGSYVEFVLRYDYKGKK